MDAIELLKRDHRELTALFQRFASGGGGGRDRRAVVEKICNELDVHAQIEEQVFYPAVRETGDDELGRLVATGLQEHQRVKDQVTALRRLGSEDGQVEGMVSKLEQDVTHHVTEEEGELFPRLTEVMNENERAEIGERLASLKRELKGERGTAGAAAPRRGGSARDGRSQASRRRKTASGARAKTSGLARGRRSRMSTKRESAQGKTARRKSRSGKKQVRGGRGR